MGDKTAFINAIDFMNIAGSNLRSAQVHIKEHSDPRYEARLGLIIDILMDEIIFHRKKLDRALTNKKIKAGENRTD